jgi:uncharacterized protein
MRDVKSAKDVVEAFETTIQGGWSGEVDLTEVLSHLHPDIEIIEAASLPYAGIWRGHAGFLELAAYFQETWRFLPGKTFEYVADDDRVVVLTLGRAVAKPTGREVEWRLAEVFVVREGLIAEIRPFYYDTAAITAAVVP